MIIKISFSNDINSVNNDYNDNYVDNNDKMTVAK